MTYKTFPVRGTDVSQYQGLVDWLKMKAANFLFAGIRVGYGNVTDKQFVNSWGNAKGKIERMPYWYMDYYSHRQGWTPIKYTDAAWGIKQAQNAWELLKNDPGELPMFLDIEPCGLAGVPGINWITAPYVMTIARAFLTEYDRLSGGKAGIYTSPGYLGFYGDWFKDRAIWLAWYYRAGTLDNIKAKLAAVKWRNRAIIWQYASDGDINDDGIQDGLALGAQTKTLDLNVFLGTVEEYSAWAGTGAGVITPPVNEDPVPIPIPPTTTCRTKVVQIMTVNVASGLNVRKTPSTSGAIVGWLANGKDVEVLDLIADGSNTWARVGQEQFAAKVYQGIEYLKA